MSPDSVLSAVQSAIFTVITVAAPPLALGLTVGILVSLFQAVTSIQEPTLAFVPKIIAVLVAIMAFGAFMLTTLLEFMQNLLRDFPNLIIPR
ncbi:MAG: flagellar biosynthesis protein FliQ [Defluviitaleaceae bacterium]|nr:flagellar biosynthesis protein FliQ [Defluviitaleaceae bacterium]